MKKMARRLTKEPCVKKIVRTLTERTICLSSQGNLLREIQSKSKGCSGTVARGSYFDSHLLNRRKN